MSRDTSRSGEFPPSRHKDWGSVRPRWCGVFRVEVRESENRAHPPSHPDGCFCRRPGRSTGLRRRDLTRHACRRRRGADAAADRGGPGRGAVARQSTDPAGHHRRRDPRHPGPLGNSAGRAQPRGLRCRLGGRPGGTGRTSRRTLRRTSPRKAATAPGSWRSSSWPRMSWAPTRPTSGAPIWSVASWRPNRPAGPPAGRFGTNAQVADYNAGPYDQGLALAALKAAGVSANAAAVSWLQNAQCPDGGWTAPDPAINPCDKATPSTTPGHRHQHHVAGLERAGCPRRPHPHGHDQRTRLLDGRPGPRRWLGLLPEHGRQSRDVRSRLDRAW